MSSDELSLDQIKSAFVNYIKILESRETIATKSIEQMKQFCNSLYDENELQLQVKTNETESLFPFNISEIITFVKTLIFEYKSLRGN